jgi:hypothetical protein
MIIFSLLIYNNCTKMNVSFLQLTKKLARNVQLAKMNVSFLQKGKERKRIN